MESETSIHGICLEIQEEAKKSLEACKTDPALLQETLELNKLHFEMVTRMFDELSKCGTQKQTCAFTYYLKKCSGYFDVIQYSDGSRGQYY